MADQLISQLGATAGVVSTDVIEIEKLAGPPSEKATIAQLVTLLNTIYQTAATPPGGADTQVQFNDVGAFGGDAGLVFNKTTNVLTVGGGLVVSAGDMNLINGYYVTAATAGFYWSTRSVFKSPSNGVIELVNNNETDFNRLQFGGTTSAFPSIKRSGAGLEFKLADDSAYAVITASMLRLTPALTVATLPAAGTQGRIAYVTDALAPAFLAIAVGGGGVITTVFDNGTNWVSV